MEDLRTRASLVAYDSSFAGSGAIGTVVTRSELAEAAEGGEFPATFVLDLEQIEAGEHATVAVDWDQDTLRQLLATMDGPEIELWFDETELAQAFDDVEGHGLREKAAVLAVAAVAAGASATPAFARFAADAQGGGGAASAATATPSAQVGGPLGAQRALVEDQQLGNVRQVHGVNVTTPAATSGGGSLSTGEIAAIAGVGTVLIAAAGFGATRKRTPPALPV